MEFMVQDKPVNTVINSSAGCNLKSELMFNFVMLDCWSAIREFLLMLL